MMEYYVLEVSHAEVKQLWKERSLLKRLRQKKAFYAEVSFCEVSQKTSTTRETVSPTWNESFPLLCPTNTDFVTIKVKHDSIQDTGIGYGEIKLSSKTLQSTITDIPLNSSKKSKKGAKGSIHIKLRKSDAVMNTRIALRNVVRDVLKSQGGVMDKLASGIDELVEGGTAVIESDLFKLFEGAIPAIDVIVNIIVGISDIHPGLQVACCVTLALYKVVSTQFSFDKLVQELVEDLAKAFHHVAEAAKLRRPLESLSSTINELLDFLTECSIFIRSYSQHVFVDRILRVGEKSEIENFKGRLEKLKSEFRDAIALQTVTIVGRDSDKNLLEKLKGKLKPADSPSGANRPECLEGTRTNLREQINLWAQEVSHPNMFLLFGLAGTGKSTVATTLAEEYRRKRKLGAHLFFQRGNSDPNNVIPTLAYNLAQYNQNIAERIDSALEGYGELRSATLKSQFEIFIYAPLHDAVRNGLKAPVLVVFDALDECGSPETRRTFVQLLQNLSTLPTNFRFLITSRPEEDIISLLSPSSSPDVMRCIHLNHRSDDSKKDVFSYVKFEFEALKSSGQLKVPADWVWDESLNTLGEAADGLFIWASTAIKFVANKKMNRFDRFKSLVQDAKSLGLNDLYETVLENSLDWDESTKLIFSRVISFIFFGRSSLIDKDMDHILGLAEDTTASLLTCLRSLIMYEPGQPIRIHHASFFDYLVSPACKDKDWYINISAQKEYFTSRCFDIMTELLRFNICNLESSYVLNKDVVGLERRIDENVPRLLQYVCCNWTLHLRDVPCSEGLRRKLENFLHKKFLYWFEVLSLTNSFGHVAGSSLVYALTWLGNADVKLSAFLRDAYRQATVFSDMISQSTPHIYTSLLPLTREYSIVSEHYAKRTTSIASVEYGGSKARSACIKKIIGHYDAVRTVAFSPDGTHIVSGSDDYTIYVWSAANGEIIIGRIYGHMDRVTSATYSSDGKYIVSGSLDGTVRFWNATDGEPVPRQTRFFAKGVWSVAISPDTRYIASGLEDGSIQLWDTRDNKAILRPLNGHESTICSICFSRDGRRIASGSSDQTVCVWDVESRRLLSGPFKGHKGTINSVRFSPDGNSVVSGSDDGSAYVWGIGSKENLLKRFGDHAGRILSVAYSPDGKYILSGSEDKVIRIWNVDDSSIPPRRFGGHEGAVLSVSFAIDGTRFISGSSDNSIRMWDAEGDMSGNKPFEGHTRGIRSISVSENGELLVSGFSDGIICLWNAVNGKLVSGPWRGHTELVTSVAFTSLEPYIVISGSEDNTVRLWKMNGESIALEGHTDFVESISVSPDGKYIASASKDKTIRIWDVAVKSTVVGPIEGHASTIRSVDYSPDGKYIVSGSDDHTICIWDASGGQLFAGPFRGHTDSVTSVSYSPNGEHIVSGSTDKSIRIWLASSGKNICEKIEGHLDWVTSVQYSPDGKWVISGSGDRTFRIWDSITGKAVFEPFWGHTHWVTSIATFPEGKKIATTSRDGTIRIWTTAGNPNEMNWVLREDGWVDNLSGELVMWIPHELRSTVCPYKSIALFNRAFYTKLDFSDAKIGSHWTESFQNLG